MIVLTGNRLVAITYAHVQAVHGISSGVEAEDDDTLTPAAKDVVGAPTPACRGALLLPDVYQMVMRRYYHFFTCTSSRY